MMTKITQNRLNHALHTQHTPSRVQRVVNSQHTEKKNVTLFNTYEYYCSRVTSTKSHNRICTHMIVRVALQALQQQQYNSRSSRFARRGPHSRWPSRDIPDVPEITSMFRHHCDYQQKTTNIIVVRVVLTLLILLVSYSFFTAWGLGEQQQQVVHIRYTYILVKGLPKRCSLARLYSTHRGSTAVHGLLHS